MSLSTNKRIEYTCIQDVYGELVKLYNISDSRGFPIGKSLYSQLGFFSDYKLFINDIKQRRIKEFIYCKQFNTSLYPTML